VLASVATTLGLIARITGQFELGHRIFKLPMWQRIRSALDRGLAGHPKAAESVARELRQLDEEDAAA